MSGFIRRYLQDPGLSELLAIEGVVIIDREPAASVTGTGSGTVIMVAEFEDGSYEPTEVMSGQDLINQFGGFGFTYDGIAANYPCARSRSADSAVTPEYWNGNGYVALVGKKFSRLVIQRVDTSVGAVSFTRLPYLVGSLDTTFNLTSSGTLVVKVDGGSSDTAIFTGTTATVSGDGSFPTGWAVIPGTMVVLVDAGTDLALGPITITFTSDDQTQADVISRINTALGYTAASAVDADTTKLVGRHEGTAGSFQIVSIDTAIATKTGFSAGTTAGGGNVVNINDVTFAEVKTVVEAAAAGALVTRNAAGQLLIASASISGSPSIEVVSTSTITQFGFATNTIITPATVGIDTTLPAGIVVTNSGGSQQWVTAAKCTVSATSAGPYTVRIRPATDDGTETSAAPAAISVIDSMPADVGLWSVTNTLAVSAAMTEAQLDVAYAAAIDRTLNPNTVAREANLIVSARQSNAIRYKLRSNVLDASANGLYGRVAVIRPPLGSTTRAMARSESAQPGVGVYRDQRVVYSYPGVRINVPAIAARGVAGGTGFTVDGNIDVGSDTWEAAIMSGLPPEENPGQMTNLAGNVLGIESGNADVQSMTISDYRAFRAAGIAAPRMDNGVMIIQSGVTSVNPSLYPGLKNIARRRMADFIQDSLGIALKPLSKKLANRTWRSLVIAAIDGFLRTLESPGNLANQRIDSWKTDYKTGNTAESLAAGLFRAIVKVRTSPSGDVIVLDTEIGEGVVTIKDAA